MKYNGCLHLYMIYNDKDSIEEESFIKFIIKN